MKYVKNWQMWLRLAILVVVVVLITMSKPTMSQPITDINSTFMRYYCSRYKGMNAKYFLSNLNATLSSLRRQLTTGGYASARTLLNGESVWGLAWCRGYMSIPDCLACYDYAVEQLKPCGLGNGAHVIYSDCNVRYENSNFYTEANHRAGVVVCDNTTSPQPVEFQKTAEKLLQNLTVAAPRASKYYAVSTRQVDDSNATVYAIAQCNLNISQSVCLECLQLRTLNLYDCFPTVSGRAMDNGCFMRYSGTPFFGQNQTMDISSLLSDGNSSKVGIIAGAVGGAVLFLFVIVFWFLYRLRKKSKKAEQDTSELKGAVNFSYKDLQLATNNFSEENILGKGGFGEVFKAILNDESVVAVKKLQVQRARAKEEFENEVKLVCNFRHRNLLRLLGWSIDGSDLLLVLEYMPNGSLDRFLWGSKKGTLDWNQRYEIIFGIARGLVHLHNEFHGKIVHRDIKSSNILLSDDFKAKIADFGLARFQPEDQTHVNTKFAGTLGYTAPEYAIHGFLSDKVDTYSFGIVILEIISGRKSTDIKSDGSTIDYLLEHAWKLFEKRIHIKLIDESLNLNQHEREHVMKIVEIALLCTQSPVSNRPTMSEVVLMLQEGQSVGQRQLTRPTFVNNQDRRIHIGSSKNSIGARNVYTKR